jgi:hypothetical protein
MRHLPYNDVSADRKVTAAVQAMEAILARHAQGQPGCVATVNGPHGGLALLSPGRVDAEVLYPEQV